MWENNRMYEGFNLDNDEEILWKKEMLGIWGLIQEYFNVRVFFNMIGTSWFLLEKVKGGFQKHGSLSLALSFEGTCKNGQG